MIFFFAVQFWFSRWPPRSYVDCVVDSSSDCSSPMHDGLPKVSIALVCVRVDDLCYQRDFACVLRAY